MADLVEKFERDLLNRHNIGFHKQFFSKDKNLTSITIKLVNEDGEKFVPFRNKKCRLPTCIYDLKELSDKFAQGGYIDRYQFFCKICDIPITFKNFVYDVTLASEIDKMWEEYNSGNKPMNVTEVQQFKDGHCEGPKPVIPAHQINSQETGSSLKNIKDGKIEVKEDILSQSIVLKSFPKINEFSKEEFSNLFYTFSANKNSSLQNKATPFGIDISKQDLDNVVNDFNTSRNVMAFFVRYIKNFLKICHPLKQDYILGFLVNDFDKFEQKASFTYLQTIKNQYRKDPKKFFSPENETGRLFLVFSYDERWIIAIIVAKTKKCIIVDFLASDLSRVSKDEMYSLVKIYLKQEFRMKPNTISFYDQAKSQTYSDCGLYICRYLANCLISFIDPLKQVVSDAEKNTYKSLIPWLVLKTHTQGKVLSMNDIQSPSEKKIEPNSITSLATPNNNNNNNRLLGSLLSKRNSNKTEPNSINESFNLVNNLTNNNDLSSPPSRSSNQSLRKTTMSINSGISQIKKKESEESDKGNIKIKKSKLADMLKEIKEEVQAESKISDAQKILDDENLFNDPNVSREEITKSQLKKILKKAEKLQNLRNEVEKNPKDNQSEILSPEEYHQKYLEYANNMNEFHNMLVFFQQNNPDLYQKIAGELTDQMENKLLARFGLLHVKQRSTTNYGFPSDLRSEQTPASRYGRKLPPLSALQAGQFNAGLNRESVISKSQDIRTLHNKKDSMIVERPRKITELRNPPLISPKREIVAKRYGVDIFLDEFNSFKEKGVLPKSIIVFFFGFLQEKQEQIPQHELLATGQRILSLGPQFYERLTNNKPNNTNINYANIKDITRQYQGVGNVIFDVFDKIAIVVKSDIGSFMLVYINTLEKKIILFDPCGNIEQSPVNNPVLFNISQFMEMEYNDKAKQTINLAKWRFAYGDITRLKDPKDSGLLIIKLVHSIYNGHIDSHAGTQELIYFKNQLLTLVGHIGVTNNKKKELGSLSKYPL